MAKAADEKKPTFEESLAQLEAIVQELEEGTIGLDEALLRYEQGVGLLRRCYEVLQKAEQRIELLAGVDGEGRPIAQPFGDPGASGLEEKAAARSRRRSAERPYGPPE